MRNRRLESRVDVKWTNNSNLYQGPMHMWSDSNATTAVTWASVALWASLCQLVTVKEVNANGTRWWQLSGRKKLTENLASFEHATIAVLKIICVVLSYTNSSFRACQTRRNEVVKREISVRTWKEFLRHLFIQMLMPCSYTHRRECACTSPIYIIQTLMLIARFQKATRLQLIQDLTMMG